MPVEVTWPPIVPSPDHLIDGVIAGLSAVLGYAHFFSTYRVSFCI
jgi:hypothetical protein